MEGRGGGEAQGVTDPQKRIDPICVGRYGMTSEGEVHTTKK
jgi:hypothetical protein